MSYLFPTVLSGIEIWYKVCWCKLASKLQDTESNLKLVLTFKPIWQGAVPRVPLYSQFMYPVSPPPPHPLPLPCLSALMIFTDNFSIVSGLYSQILLSIMIRIDSSIAANRSEWFGFVPILQFEYEKSEFFSKNQNL